MSFQKKKVENQLKPATLLLVEGKYAKSMRRIIQDLAKRSLAEHENKRIYSKLVEREKIFGLSGMKDFE
jgi:hypothetical protein